VLADFRDLVERPLRQSLQTRWTLQRFNVG